MLVRNMLQHFFVPFLVSYWLVIVHGYEGGYFNFGGQLVSVLQDLGQLINDTTFLDYSTFDGEDFDFIVVGAGSAGAVVASRLSENPLWRVLLLEAGEDPTLFSEIPELYSMELKSKMDWKYNAEPSANYCLGKVDGVCQWPRGKVLGGSSTINALFYLRGNPRDYDEWEQMGNPGWGYASLLPFFKKSEDMRVEEVLKVADALTYHSVGGPLKIESFRHNNFFLSKLLGIGFENLGYKILVDLNAQSGEGFFNFQGTIENGRRCSTAKAFLLRFQTRPNLKISKNSFVTKVFIEQNTAYGVEFIKDNTTFTVRASKEIVVSAGSINTPKLLMLSGLGPRELLESFEIEVQQDLRVGYNLQDHPVFTGFLVTLNDTGQQEAQEANLQKQLSEYLGILFNCGLFTTSQETHPNVQYYFTYFGKQDGIAKTAIKVMGFNEDMQNLAEEATRNRFTVIIAPAILRPKSRGRVLISSSDPQAHPLIYPEFFSNEEDVKEMLEAIEFANRLVETEPFRRLGAEVARLNIPECERHQFQTKGYWRCLLKYASDTVHHSSGTCRMGPTTSKDSVVDSSLKVIGVRNLRVVDASVMPRITSGNTNAPTIAIAEKASELIKGYWS